MIDEVVQLKLLTIGDSGVGKTWLLLRWAGVSGQLSKYSSSMPTIGIDFKMKTVVVNKKRMKIQVWDTAGQERFRTITTSYYRHSHGILLVYDITDEISFENIRSWITQINAHADPDTNVLIIGNKRDLEKQRVVSYEQGFQLAKEFNLPFVETSAIDGTNVDEAFMKLITSVHDRLEHAGLLRSSRGVSNRVANDSISFEEESAASRKCC